MLHQEVGIYLQAMVLGPFQVEILLHFSFQTGGNSSSVTLQLMQKHDISHWYECL